MDKVASFIFIMSQVYTLRYNENKCTLTKWNLGFQLYELNKLAKEKTMSQNKARNVKVYILCLHCWKKPHAWALSQAYYKWEKGRN